MSDFFFYHSEIKKNNLAEAASEYQNIYKDPLVFKTNTDKLQSVLICNPKASFIKPFFSEKFQKHFWIHGNIFYTDHFIQKFSIKSPDKYLPDEGTISELSDKYGIEVFKELAGWFNVITYSPLNNEIEIINSRLGMLPLYYYIKKDLIIIASRLGIFYRLFDNLEINQGVIIQQCLYNYAFSDSTHIRNVMCMPSGTILKIANSKPQKKKYWSVREEFADKPLSRKQSADLLDETLNSVIKRLCCSSNNLALSLTGGWDGRLILAYALKYISKEKLTLYSFGAKESPDIIIPSEISKKHNLNYTPIILDDEYLKFKFNEFARRTIFYSDAYRSLKRAHYLYAMDFLTQCSDSVITGIGGSNLLKSTAYKPSNVFNNFVFGLIGSNDPENELEKQFLYVKQNYNLFDDYKIEEFIDSFDLNQLADFFKIKNRDERFCTYLVSSIERKYFGAEISAYRHLIFSYSPFLDYQFIHNLLKTSFFGGYNKIKLFPSFRNALLYNDLINRNNDFLTKENTDRNIPLNSLLNPLTYLNSGFNYIFRKGRGNKDRISLYNTQDAVRSFIETEKFGISNLTGHKKLNNDFSANYISLAWFIQKMSRGAINLENK